MKAAAAASKSSELMSDNEALDRARAGDVEAFAELFEALRPMVFAVACRMVGPNDAEDVVMSVYLKAWRALPGFNGRSTLKSWLYRITCNACLDLVRARNRRKEVQMPEAGPDSAAELPDESGHSPADGAALTDLAGLVDACLAELPDLYRTTLLLRHADGLSYKDIAAATGVSVGTVMSRLFNGRRKLQQRIRAAGQAPSSLR
jgi:RNA polymerase sigma-70 factor (ECF subfamily)